MNNMLRKIKAILIIVILSLSSVANVSGQNEMNNESKKQISISYSVIPSKITDKLIDLKPYQGYLSGASIVWLKKRNKYIYKFDASVVVGDLTQEEITSSVVGINISQGFLYELPSFFVFGKEVKHYLGPSFDFYLHGRTQEFATGELLTPKLSSAALISVALSSRQEVNLSKKIMLNNSSSINLVSLGLRLHDFSAESYRFAQLQTPLSALTFRNKLAVDFVLLKHLKSTIAYRYELVNLSNRLSKENWSESGWSEFYAVKHGVSVGLTFVF